MNRVLSILLVLTALAASAAEVIPPRPARYFNDQANVISAATAARLNQTLEQFERETSNQILVAIYAKMQSDSAIEDYTVRVAQNWRVGQQNKDNGAVLFVFTQDRKMFLQVGYGLEAVLPDALCKQIIENEIRPQFRSGNFDAGLSRGVTAILAATKGEYRGTGRTVADNRQRTKLAVGGVVFAFLVALVLILIVRSALRQLRGRYYHSGGWQTPRRRSSNWGGMSWGGGSSGGGGGGWSGGGGGFSAGGGSFGGGGAGGSW